VARRLVLAIAFVAALLPVSGAGGADAQTPKRGGTLVIGTRPASEPGCLNLFTCELQVTLPQLLAEVLPGAFEVAPDATFRPDLADAEIVSKEPFTLLYRIRPQARWSDGTPVTGKDFEFTDRVSRTHRGPEDWHRKYVRSVRALDAKTVRVVMRSRFVDWRYLFDTVLPRHALAGAAFNGVWEDDITNPRTGRAIGSGPMLLEQWERGKQITFVRNPRYWGPHSAYLDRLVLRFLPVADIEPAMRRGDIDMIDPGPAVLSAAHVAFHRHPAPGVTARRVVGASYENLVIRAGRGGHPALANPLVRRALAYGVDRVEIARTIGRLSGASPPGVEPIDSAVYLPNSPYYRPNWRGYRHRQTEARRLLALAGCRIGPDGIYVCAGVQMSLRFVTAAGVEARELTVRLAQAQLRRIGVEVRPVFLSPQALFLQVVPSGEFDVGVWGWGFGAGTSGPLEVFGCQQVSNFMGYCDRLVTRDLVQATRILDDSLRVGLLNRIDARLAKAAPTIPLFQHSAFFAYSTNVRGIVPNGPGSFAWNAENWWLDD
jgi:peptide/nickel transport system substrate-binding protein